MSISFCPSIVAALDVGSAVNVGLLVLSGVSVVAAFLLGILPPGRVSGPARIPVNRSALPLVAVFFGAFSAYLLVQIALDSMLKTIYPGSTTESLLDSDMGAALFSTVPNTTGLLALLAGDALVFDLVRQNLGFGPKRFMVGAAKGVSGALLVLPPLFLFTVMMEALYERTGYQHPAVHPLLHVLGTAPNPLARAAIVVGACVLAPLWEELLFRGHLQTLLKRLCQRLRLPGATWLAVLLTSLLFMSLHPAWSRPIILLLAIFLGYAYERTGNLWVPITLHALFNTSETLLFLWGAGPH